MESPLPLCVWCTKHAFIFWVELYILTGYGQRYFVYESCINVCFLCPNYCMCYFADHSLFLPTEKIWSSMQIPGDISWTKWRYTRPLLPELGYLNLSNISSTWIIVCYRWTYRRLFVIFMIFINISGQPKISNFGHKSISKENISCSQISVYYLWINWEEYRNEIDSCICCE